MRLRVDVADEASQSLDRRAIVQPIGGDIIDRAVGEQIDGDVGRGFR